MALCFYSTAEAEAAAMLYEVYAICVVANFNMKQKKMKTCKNTCAENLIPGHVTYQIEK